jgi:arylesterase/paraoxonase
MRRTRRLAIVFSAVVLVGVVALVLRGLDAMGVFTDVAPVACGEASPIRGVAGAGAMQYDATSNALFVSATDARVWPAHPSAKDGIYLIRPGDAAAPLRLPGTSAGFHPFGITLFRASDGSLTLMAITRPANGNPAIDIFDVSDAATAKIALHERESIAGDLLVSPAGIVAVDKGRFYATNEHTSRAGVWLMLERILMLARANVVYFDGADFRAVAQDLRAASGIGVSADGAHLYVAETTGREIRTFARNIFSGDLGPVSALPIASGLAQLDVGAQGELFVAGAPKLIDALVYRRDPAKTAASQVYRVSVDARGVPVSAKLVYAGTDIGAADAALPVRDRLLIGSGLDSKILSCALPG